jgi:hypothetical protein
MYFGGYTVDHIDTFALVTEDNIFETLVSIIEDLKDKTSEAKVENMLVEELFEVLLGVEAKFNTVNHVHKWICECQQNEDDASRVVNETIIHLPSLTYTSIEQSDEILKEMMREQFQNTQIFEQFLKLKYGENAEASEFNIEEELKQIKISEPYTLAENGNIYKFRYLRVKDILFANQAVAKKYAGKIKALKNIFNTYKEKSLYSTTVDVS